MMDMAMTSKFAPTRAARRLGVAFGIALAASGAQAQQPSLPYSGVSYDAPPADAQQSEVAPGEAAPAPSGTRPRRGARASIHPYLEVAQIVSTDLDADDTLTYTTVAAGVDAQVNTRRVTVQLSYRYERLIDWQGEAADSDVHSGVALVRAEVVPGALSLEAGALASRTGGEGRAVGVTDRDSAVEVYSVYGGPTLSTHAGPVAINASYRLGYVAVDDDSTTGGPRDDFSSAVAHSATASIGMAPGHGAPIGWTVGAGYARTDSNSRFDDDFEAKYVRGDVVVPLGPTFALTAGVGYENIDASQLDIQRDALGVPVLDPTGRPLPDPSRPRLVTTDISGVIYDGGFIWRPTARTEVQARAGHRYGGTTVVGSLSHQFRESFGVNLAVFDTVETFGNSVMNNLSSLPDTFNVNRNPLTGDISGCNFGTGTNAGQGGCLSPALQSIRGTSFRARGASLVLSGERGLWDYGVGASYVHRRYGRPSDPAFDVFGSGEDDNFNVFASASRRLSRTSTISFDTYASWYDNGLATSDQVVSTGATISYSRSFLLERLRLLAALGIDRVDDGVEESTILSGLAGLRYTF
jgi:hypothetical protein